jgi:hypothetical protein
VPPARPTIRCLRDDLGLAPPPVDDPLDEVGHPLVRRAGDQFGDPAGPRERIRAVDDRVLYKVKTGRWRGAVWIEDDQPWLVAAGWREDGSPEDFYEALAASARASRARYNASQRPPLTTDAHTGHLLPTRDDHDRRAAEDDALLLRRTEATVRRLTRESLLSGRERRDAVAGATLGVLVRAGHGNETYVALRIVGSVPDNLLPVVLDLVPGCSRDGWYPELEMPTRPLASNEQVWSNLMDPAAAAELLSDGAEAG